MLRVRIASWNTRGSFDLEGRGVAVAPRADWRLNALRGGIDRLRAEIVGLQEIESRELLDEVNRGLERPFEHAAVVPGNSPRGYHLGFLSRFPLELTSHRDERLVVDGGDARFSRDVLRADVVLPGFGDLAVFNLHLKSQRAPGPTADGEPTNDALRLAEARAAAEIVAAATADGRPAVVLGDLNAPPADPTVAPLVRGLDLLDPIERDWVGPAREPVYSYHRRPFRSRLDAILLCRETRRRYRPDSARIHRNPATRRASDHFPVSVDLLFTR